MRSSRRGRSVKPAIPHAAGIAFALLRKQRELARLGDEATLRRMGAEYGLMFQQETINVEHEHEQGHDHNLDDENYFVQHTSPSFLIDRDGYLRMVYFYGTQPDVIAEGIRQILQS